MDNNGIIQALGIKDAFSIESEQLIKAHESGLKVINTNMTSKYNYLKTS